MDITNEERKGALIKAGDSRALLINGVYMLVSFLFARCHTLFGAHPLAIALLSSLPTHLFPSLAGAVVGSLTLGREGIVLSLVLAITVFLRLAIFGGSCGVRGDGIRLNEGILLRVSVSVIGGFILSVYKILLSGFGKAEILYSLFMILATPVLSFVFALLFESGFSHRDVLQRLRYVVALRGCDKSERVRRCAFFSSLLAVCFLLSLSLKSFELFGISLCYIFTSALALLASKKSGALIGGAIAFFSALALSPIHAAAFALLALSAGALFGIGLPYALIGGGAVLSLFAGFSEGVSGFLTVFPEYVIGTALCYPLLKKLKTDAPSEDAVTGREGIKDMVGTMALAYQSRYQGRVADLDRAFSEAAKAILAGKRKEDNIYQSVYDAVRAEISYAAVLLGVNISEEDLSDLAKMVAAGEDYCNYGERLSSIFGGAQYAKEIGERLILTARNIRDTNGGEAYFSEALSIASGVLKAALREDEIERGVDHKEEERLSEILTRSGLDGGVLCALGERQRHLIIAGFDPSGTVITDPIIKRSLEELSVRPFGNQEYYRRGNLVLMECTARPKLALEHAASSYSYEGDVSGDSVAFVSSRDGRAYAVLSDGMGTGSAAKEASELVTGLFSALGNGGIPAAQALHLINSIIRARGGEISATVDLFELDAMCGEACFLKCGAAVSYVKRGSSIFRIRSRSAPIGLLSLPDAERVGVEIRDGDIIVMLSDGINPTADDAPWLLDLLSRAESEDLKALADSVIATARSRATARDDMTAVVLRIVKT